MSAPISAVPYTVQHPLKVLGDYIGGEFHPPSDPTGEWTVTSPAATKDVVARIKYSFSEVDRAVAAARDAFRKWRLAAQSERNEVLGRYQAALKKREAILAETIARETGKPLWEAKTEVTVILNKFDITLKESLPLIRDIEIPDVMPGTLGTSRYRPLGVMVVIGPFNFPGHLPNGHIVPALATGNTVIFKPSEKTPMTGQLMAEAAHEAGFPPGVFNLLQGERELSRRLSIHEGVAGILFTGSYEVGTRIKQDTLQQHWKLLALEMGGKNPTIVWDDVDLDAVAYDLLTSGFLTAGQRCTSTSRVLIHEGISAPLIEKIHKAAKAFKIGHPFEDPFMGPLIDAQSVDRFQKFQPIAAREGFEIVMRGKSLDLPYGGFYVTPSIAVGKGGTAEQTKKSVFQQTELFAPMLSFQTVESVEQAIALANATQYGLAASVYSRSRKVFDECYRDLEFGVVNWNRSTVGSSSRLPFGGFKKSGNHHPTALTSVFYCTHPVATHEIADPKRPTTTFPGLVWES
ncbi:MAG: aldehyde dehydrogenase family protein [Bdellovibrionales bacterium]|nr:aldehyde dehydrogenase family protein [Bdellovibrionales bacterium]